MHTLTPSDVAALLDDLAQLLPFPTMIYTDMGADSWTPQLYFGPVDPSSDLPEHRAGIDADTVRPVWWIDLDGCRERQDLSTAPASGRAIGSRNVSVRQCHRWARCPTDLSVPRSRRRID